MSLAKFQNALTQSGYTKLPQTTIDFLSQKIQNERFSFQQIRQILDMAMDFHMWQGKTIESLWPNDTQNTFEALRKYWLTCKESPRDYGSTPAKYKGETIQLQATPKQSLGLGRCPVASPKTRCCNLMTLDAVESCGFDCSYCAVQSFYNEGTVEFDTNFAQKLRNLAIEPSKTYHIGTGQSSDSLMWGNREGIMDALFEFATTHPNVILELKTKSDNIDYLLKNPIPENIITTWSLNPQSVIDHEEHRTASLEARLNAAKAIANKGNLVGFHFHPMVYHEGWEEAYGQIAQRLIADFDPSSVALVSMGALTFIKPVIKKLRRRAMPSKILQMPLTQTNGKFSYTFTQKQMLFSSLYRAFSPWHGKVFFYMCMEEIGLWERVFGYEYPDNEALEIAMIEAYKAKIAGVKK
jgi:spore photoproduct lyase